MILLAKPMGKQPKNRDWAGCEIMAGQISGYSVYLKKEMMQKMTKRRTLRAKKMYEMTCSQ
ncbi:hypothetical protein MKX07_008543 [Trichoderma sp. CBMAI-0711]|nr:hypothetical protein MKX07_008543 [Trichoderma sp. CBMAI-0711]